MLSESLMQFAYITGYSVISGHFEIGSLFAFWLCRLCITLVPILHIHSEVCLWENGRLGSNDRLFLCVMFIK